MPIYEYRCAACGSEFEELTSSANGGARVTCSSCGSKRVTKLLSAFAVQTESAAERAPESPCGGCSPERRGMCGIE